jgi:hypothetical protein
MAKYPPLENLILKDDEAALSHLKSVWIDYKEDPREYDFVFASSFSAPLPTALTAKQEFDSENPFFSNRKLVKTFRLDDLPKESKDIDVALFRSFDISFPLKGGVTAIDWTSDDHNLVKKKPRVNVEALEEFECACRRCSALS